MLAVPVIGRDAERAAIARWLTAPRPAHLRLQGPAGIGKTTLFAYAVDKARQGGDRVLSWSASEAEQGFAFATLTALFDGIDGIDGLDRLAAPRRAALAIALGRADPADAAAPAPHLAGLAVADLLRDMATSGPVLVAIDDLQFVDAASEGVLAFALRRLGSAAVAELTTRRGVAPAAAGDEILDVGPLSIASLGQLLRERLDLTLPRPLLVRVHAAVAGNSFLALEIGRTLRDRPAMPGPGEPFPVPPDYEPLVRDRLACLGPQAKQAVVLVAMTAEPRVPLIAAAVGADAVDEACRHAILVADGDRLRPAHPLYGSTAFFDSPPGERRALHRLMATVATDPVEQAVHLAATVDGPDEHAASTIAAAGRVALARGAPGAAADLLERAAVAAVDRRAEFLVAAAQSAAAAGDTDRASALLRAALDAVPAGGGRVPALLALGELVYMSRPAEALAILVSALDHTGNDPVLEATVHAYIAGMGDVDPLRANDSAERAAELLDRPGLAVDPDQLACALLDRAFHQLLRGDSAASNDIDRGLELRTGTGASFVARRAQEVAERCLFHLGRLDEARALDEAEYQRLMDSGEFGLLPPMAQTLSALTLLAGDWVAARRYADECLDFVAQGAHAWQERSMLAVARVRAWDGDLEQARAIAAPALAAQEAAGDRWEATIFAALLGFIELSVPDPVAARAHLVRALAHQDAIDVRLPTQFRFLGDLVEADVLAGDLDHAEFVLRERLEPSAQRQKLPWTMTMALRGRGMLASAQGDLVAAIDWLDQAVAVYDTSLAMPFERARTLYIRGQAKRRAGQRRAARADLVAAGATFDQLGARAWTALVDAESSRIGGRIATGIDLTAAERSVADRAAAGRSNKEIAAELRVSIRTVESQLSAVYRKLNIRSRSQIAAALRMLA